MFTKASTHHQNGGANHLRDALSELGSGARFAESARELPRLRLSCQGHSRECSSFPHKLLTHIQVGENSLPSAGNHQPPAPCVFSRQPAMQRTFIPTKSSVPSVISICRAFRKISAIT